MSELSIFEKSQEIRFETEIYANTCERVANVLDDLNDTKANKSDVSAAIQDVIDELTLVEQEIYGYVDAEFTEIYTSLNKKIDKPLWQGYEQQFIVVSTSGSPANLRPITIDANRVPFWTGNTFFSSPIFVDINLAQKVGINNTLPTETLDVGGTVRADAFRLNITAENSVPNKIWTDGVGYYFNNNSGIKKKVAIGSVFIYTPTGNFTISEIKAALEAQGMIFNDCHINVQLGSNNYTCTIDIGTSHPYRIFTMDRNGTGSISFLSTRTLNAGADNITILSGAENSMCMIKTGTSVDFLNIRIK